MSRQWPSWFVQEAKRNPGKVFGLEPDPGFAGECENCGGRGFLTAFFAERGPFLKIPPCGKKESLHSVEDPIYGWRWYVGKTMIEYCPVCNGRSLQGIVKRKPAITYEEYLERRERDGIEL